ncbi:MAG: hypothetical protein NXI15_05600 [Gammaproteobacteria bacterium]|nr:hypothetical protein [Gammaproteobacteria bacterium]
MQSLSQDILTWQRIESAKSETKSKQAKRIVDHLYIYGPTLTGDLCQQTATQNLSAAVAYIKPALEKQGLTVIAELPKPLQRNRFGEVSQSHVWRIERLR